MLALWIIVLAKPVQALILTFRKFADPLAFPRIPSLFLGAIAAVLAIPGAFQVGSLSPFEFWLGLKQGAVSCFFHKIGYAAVSEEPLFRVILWGVLRKLGWKEVWICLFEASLFTLAHMYTFSKYPISMFIIVPVTAPILGLVVWKSRTISASLPLHGAANAPGSLVACLAAYCIK